jgi:hypothetical protein
LNTTIRAPIQLDPELLAAKICGSWRNGVPLALSPETRWPRWGVILIELARELSQNVRALRICLPGDTRNLNAELYEIRPDD